MKRIVSGVGIGLLLACVSPALAQRGPGGPPPGRGGTSEDVRKLQAEIEKLQAEIKEAEAQIRQAQDRKKDPRPKTPMGGGGERPSPKSGGERPGFGPPGGFGGSGFGGGGTFGPFGGSTRFGNDVKSLKAQLEQLHESAKMIAERTKDVEARLKQAIEAEERAAKNPPPSTGASDIEKRLDRLEKALDEIRQELRKKK